jgi:3-deoxy-D-manno-octulosonic acid kinase
VAVRGSDLDPYDAAEMPSFPRPAPDYRELRHQRGFTLVRADLAAALERGAASNPDPFAYRFRELATLGGGRRPLSVVELEGAGVKVVHKRLRRGGILGGLLGERASAARARQEVAVVRTLEAANVPVVALLAARATHDALLPFLAKIDLLVEPIDGAVDLLRFLTTSRTESHRRAVIERAGAVVAAMHAAAVFHVDLNLRNLLVTPQHGVVLLDFGASRIGELSDSDRAANLARLWRSCVKRGLARTCVSRSDVLRFLRGYDRQRARDWFHRARRASERTIRFHRLLWRASDRAVTSS